MNKQRNIIIIAVGLLLTGILAWNVALFISRRGLDKIEVYAIPSDSTVTLDGDKVSQGSIYVSPGNHLLEASRTYFTKDVTTINTTTEDTSDPLYLLPNPSTSGAQQWLADHPKEQVKREGILSKIVAAEQKKLQQKYPFIKELPVYNSHYRIDYSLDDSNQIQFSVTLYAILNNPSQRTQYLSQLHNYKAEALQYLEKNGIDTSSADISFTPEV